ncbi:hypothetical protein K491DRAFT_446394 [Lophiostoma macrostomum CBS 122681]|uniref:Heterokaryon incompatibility domain-containing protein n=1 Tax=Lophiostoma macrostomum CBS 122681 TaxID=1314788 RepID=A0A6A6T4G4_9PLEO|nr:hypothetical protein K491DRAFT_446394 [Lophiostoma macrostomum CBS 122681]
MWALPSFVGSALSSVALLVIARRTDAHMTAYVDHGSDQPRGLVDLFFASLYGCRVSICTKGDRPRPDNLERVEVTCLKTYYTIQLRYPPTYLGRYVDSDLSQEASSSSAVLCWIGINVSYHTREWTFPRFQTAAANGSSFRTSVTVEAAAIQAREMLLPATPQYRTDKQSLLC